MTSLAKQKHATETFALDRCLRGSGGTTEGQYRGSAVKMMALIALMISGLSCTGGRLVYPPAAADARADSVTIETKTLEIGPEKYIADLGTITVPENRNVPTSRLISIPFLRIRSHAENPAEPAFAFAGGPGQTNMSWNRGKASVFLLMRDFVTVGYRGVDGSVVLDLPEVTQVMKESGDPLGEKAMQAMGRAWTAGGRRLRAGGIDLDSYTMLEVIEDNESVRKALGYDRIDLLSESYGTRVAYLYGLRHPDRIFRSAMIAVNPPGRFAWEAKTIDSQLRQYAALWAKDPVMSAEYPDLYAIMRRVLADMPRRWLVFPIDPGKVKVVTFALLFHRKTAAMAFDAFVAADRGDPSGLALMSMAYGYVLPSMSTWGDLACKAYSADFDSTRDYATVDSTSATPLGSPMTKMVWGPLAFGTWPMKLLPEKFRKLRHSDVETLLLSGSVDFSTPAKFATTDLLPYLKNGRQVVISEAGHVNDLWHVNPENTRRMLTTFYDSGVPDTSMNTYVPMDFNVGLGFPTIAKLAVGAVLVVGTGLAAVLIWLL